jgi:hypothetical protein
MAQSLELNIKTTSDVPQAMDKAKAATTSFGKQVDDIGRKFGTSFKDIFLSFVGPMALVTGAMALINKMIAENERKRAEANQAAIDGTNELMSAEDKYWANKRKNEKKASEETEQASVIREETTRQFMIFERDRAIGAMSEKQKASFLTGARMEEFTRDPEYQKKIQAIIAEDIKKNPEAGAAAVKDSKPSTFKGPEGFSNVVGVGANPVMEAMNAQLEEQRKQTALLERMANAGFSQADGWMTAPASVAAPSRAALLRGKQ